MQGHNEWYVSDYTAQGTTTEEDTEVSEAGGGPNALMVGRTSRDLDHEWVHQWSDEQTGQKYWLNEITGEEKWLPGTPAKAQY